MIPVKDFAEVLSLHAALSLSVVLALLVLYYAISPATDDDNGKLWKNIRLLPDCPRLYQLLLLGPNILFFWWLICLKGCSLWWLSAIASACRSVPFSSERQRVFSRLSYWRQNG